MSKPKRYRPVFKGKDAEMRFDESGDWTSLSCYYLLHDENERLRGQVEHYITALGKQEVLNLRLVKAGDALSYALQTCKYSAEEIAHYSDAWLAAKETQL
jgi:hypothetical protein